MKNFCNNLPFFFLMESSKAIQERMKMELTEFSLNLTEFSVLEVLYHKDKQTIQQIVNHVLISSGSMTYVIDKLEQRGLLNRMSCPDDRRAIHIALTNGGQQLMEKIMPKHWKFVNDLFEPFNEEKKTIFIDMLKKIKMRTKK
ncbi:MarR family winged helix-turn-helix transcriptional regulator [Cytobacillus sp. Hz8]|uniref:MarR family winged helix-turn-helix transcriptional regulator n=1 Tax=Cytobacillus sp. Hz8 TaxID=3347168 RepID=UPI0035DFE6A9